MHSTAAESVPFILCPLLLPILSGSRLKMLDSACARLFVQGGELTSEITPERWETAQPECACAYCLSRGVS